MASARRGSSRDPPSPSSSAAGVSRRRTGERGRSRGLARAGVSDRRDADELSRRSAGAGDRSARARLQEPGRNQCVPRAGVALCDSRGPRGLGQGGALGRAALAAVALFPLWVRLTEPDAPYTFWASVVLALLIAYAHRANIRRLMKGTENRFRTRRGVAA